MCQDFAALAEQRAQLQVEIQRIQNIQIPANNDQSFGEHDFQINEDSQVDLRRELVASKDAQHQLL